MKQIKVKRDYQAAPKGGTAVPIGAPASQVPSSALPVYHGIPYSEIVDAWLGGKAVAIGDRHYTSLMLADQLRYITENDPVLIEQILRATPFVDEIVRERNENVAQTVKSAMDYEFLKGIPKRMQEAIEKVKNEKLKIKN